MKKSELKSAFDKKFKNIEVSEELKAKTLKTISEAQTSKTSHFPYLRNFAAVFVVSLLCLSVYLAKNPVKQKGSEINVQTLDINGTQTDEDLNGASTQSFDTNEVAKKSIDTTSSSNNSISFNSTSSRMVKEDLAESTTDSLIAPQSADDAYIMVPKSADSFPEVPFMMSTRSAIMTEESFLAEHPEAEKTDDGYIIDGDEGKVLYTFTDGLLDIITPLE